jgi:hypothetical protein
MDTIRRFYAIAGSLAALAISLAIAAIMSVDGQGSAPSNVYRLPPIIAGASAALAILVLCLPVESKLGIRLTPRWRAVLVVVSAFGWGAGMFALAGWVLPAEPRCPFITGGGEGTFIPANCGGYGAQGVAAIIGVAGGALILLLTGAVHIYDRSRAPSVS